MGSIMSGALQIVNSYLKVVYAIVKVFFVTSTACTVLSKRSVFNECRIVDERVYSG